jgi:membrane-associated phospholipid phosphatase
MAHQAFSAATMPGRDRGRRRGELPSARQALWLAGLCLIALALVWVVAQLVPAARARDIVALRDFTQLDGPKVGSVARFVLHLLDPMLYVIWAAVLVLIALARERGRVALAVAVVLTLAPLSADRLKPLLAHPHPRLGEVGIGAASWPSGHATAAAALAMCAVLVAPARMRLRVAVLGAAFALGAGCAMLIREWHMPSDVLGGYLLAGLWTALALAGVRLSERRAPSRALPASKAARPPALRPPAR